MKRIFLISLILIVIVGCGDIKPEAIGSFNRIYAYADPQEIDFVKEPLEIALEYEISTPRPEKLFKIFWGDTSDFVNTTQYHIVLIVASLKSPEHFGAFVRISLSTEALDSVEKGKFNIFVKRNTWARNQILIILTGRTPEEVRSYILTHTDEIFEIVNSYCNENITHWIYSSFQGKHEKFDLENKIIDDYGFGIRIPRMFDWEKGAGRERFLWLRALEPERWVFVWWTPLDSVDSGQFTLRWLRTIRDSLCNIYYESDSILDGTLTYEHTRFNDFPAIKYRGRWRNWNAVAGGPLVGYVFDDTLHNRRYILDGAVFAPAVRKEPYLRHCEAIINTFDTDTVNFRSALRAKVK